LKTEQASGQFNALRIRQLPGEPLPLLAEETISRRKTPVAQTLDAARIETHVGEGVQLMKFGQWEAAAGHFRNEEAAACAGLIAQSSIRGKIHGAPRDPAEYQKLVDDIEYSGWHYPGRIDIPWIARASDFSLKGATEEQLRLFSKLSHELVLLQAEEWVHALQEAKNGPVSKRGALVPLASRSEVDVAMFFSESGIPLTEWFLGRYHRGAWMMRLDKPSDHSTAFAAVAERVGTRPFTISRDSKADVHIPEEFISREQLIAQRVPEGFRVQNGKETVHNCHRDLDGRWHELKEPVIVPRGGAVALTWAVKIEL
jgi:hypothetical protein